MCWRCPWLLLTNILSSTANELSALLNLPFIRKQADSHTITIDKDVHNKLKSVLSYNDRQCSFKKAMILLYGVWVHESFENPWMHSEWESCHRYMPHILNLRNYFFVELIDSNTLKPPWELCELLKFYQKCVVALAKPACLTLT